MSGPGCRYEYVQMGIVALLAVGAAALPRFNEAAKAATPVVEDPLPDVLVGDPRCLLEGPHEPLPRRTATAARLPSTYGIPFAQSVFHQVLVEGPHSHHTLLDSRVRQSRLRIQRGLR
ncbi:hypothetical protein [Streptomyces sp. NPDC056468]|uniref:hypothetical protein n=1 Tax=Streptomyces sp. NPDC056468 TaxID=3345830 RepID=UPI0036B03A0E